MGTTVHTAEQKKNDPKPQSEAEVDEKMNDPKMKQVSNVRHKARKALRAEGKPIPKLLEKGMVRDIVAKKPEAIAAVKSDAKGQVEAAQEDGPKEHTPKEQDQNTKRADLDEKMKAPKVVRAAVLRKKARKELRKKGQPIPPILKKGLLRDIVARKREALVTVAMGTTVHTEERKKN